jgi:hypothetical protein
MPDVFKDGKFVGVVVPPDADDWKWVGAVFAIAVGAVASAALLIAGVAFWL